MGRATDARVRKAAREHGEQLARIRHERKMPYLTKEELDEMLHDSTDNFANAFRDGYNQYKEKHS